MTTTELIKRLSNRLNISQKEARQLVHQELGIIGKHLSQNNNIIIRGFGSFGLRDSRSSKTSKSIFFRASAKLKEFVHSWRPE